VSTLSGKRIIIATLSGVLVGYIDYYLGLYFEIIEINLTIFVWIMINRIMLGVVVGISILKVDWTLRGAVIGAIMGVIFSFYIFMVTNAWDLIAVSFVISVLFGITIELITTVVFKCKVTNEH
jgi:Na+/proline symporter